MSEPVGLKKRTNGRPVIAYLKPSDYCNVGCDHCYLPAAVRASKFRMSEETLQASLKTVEKMVASQNSPGALIVWHGGEPLALPQDYFHHICAAARAQIPAAIQSIQTSLIPYKHSWAPLISEYLDHQIGTSVDFSQRTVKGSSSAYLDLWMKKVEMARRDGFLVTPGMVPSKSELGKGEEIVEWLDDKKFSAWNIDRYNSFAKDDPSRPTNKEHSSFLTEIFDAVMHRFITQGKFVRVNTVSAALGGILANAPGDRWGGSCSHDFIVVNPDGSTNACPDKISYESFSNIKDGYRGFKISEERKKWIRDHLLAHQNSHCSTCQFNSFCKSGCPLTPNTPDTEGECSGYHSHLKHVRDWCQKNRSAAKDYLELASS